MRDFNCFIEEAELEDLPLVGRKYTWFRSDGTAMSRLDRFLMSTEFLLNFPDLIQKGLKRDISYHCPILLVNSGKDWGPKPFRSLDCWLDHKEFSTFVQEKWNSYNVEGREGFRLKEKLKWLKSDLKEWNKEVFGHIDKNLEIFRDEIKMIDDKGENGILLEVEIEQRRAFFQEFWEWSSRKDSLLFQKSRQRWLQEGDANSKYFHGCIVRRQKRNGIEGVMKNKVWIEDVPEVKKYIKEYFELKFQEDEWSRPSVNLNGLEQLGLEENSWLIAEFSEEEIRETVWNCNGSKSPGPDGFNFNFIKRLWPTLKQDIVAFAKEFWANGKLVKGNGIVIANEVIHEANRRKRPTLIFKADFEKAYDSVNWNFLDSMMNKFGFCLKWRSWIKECLLTSSVSVLVNGSPTEEFRMKKGLRQGDPLAPFLFLLVAEALNGLILKAKEQNLYKGSKVGIEGLEITHLQFADDSIFFCEASAQNIKAIKGVLRTFELVSGLKVNFFKSALYGINVNPVDLCDWAETLNCVVGTIPFKYLGIPIGANPRKLSTWTPVIEGLRRKLSNWKCESLSFGGRIVLLNAVLSKGVRKIAWVKWDKVCRNKKEGGLGVKDLDRFNLALLGKWRWRLVVEKDALWNKVVEAKYGVHRRRDWVGKEVKSNCSSWWKALWNLDKDLRTKEGWVHKGMVKTMGEGNDTLFWHEKWCGDMSFKEKFNRLFRLAEHKDVLENKGLAGQFTIELTARLKGCITYGMVGKISHDLTYPSFGGVMGWDKVYPLLYPILT
ncbi:hypothetical protein SLEP1_g37737 [Rubroshorea leprosula]|uniref:Reverse transcriptase domain-containing protein n=1 Tax=Rubroshorea leprosula TaxID=152421 RepID=A0AAV5KW49_9ROSI|nr:hypothetical protein SLEP1_g37737 [Rubroshorea leprosula]